LYLDAIYAKAAVNLDVPTPIVDAPYVCALIWHMLDVHGREFISLVQHGRCRWGKFIIIIASHKFKWRVEYFILFPEYPTHFTDGPQKWLNIYSLHVVVHATSFF